MDNSFTLLDPLTAREKDILRLIVAGLSNREIAVQLYLTEGTVKWHNKHIFDKLAVRSRAEAIAKSHELDILSESALVVTQHSNLPSQPTEFVGRDEELQAVVTHLRDQNCRLITLTGMGGIGKTRLAIQAATQAQSSFKDGAYFVSLEAVPSPDGVTPAVAQSCRLFISGTEKPQQQLLKFLQRKELLLILDNFEHLLEAQADILDILQQTQHVKIIITSRIPLLVREEWVIPVNGMTFPDQDAVEHPDQFDAVRLFHACAKRAGVGLNEDNLSDIWGICQLTQGMPLAIELAASWLRTLTCKEIAQHLSEHVDLVAVPLQDLPERHHSIQRVFEHSWNLLSENDQRILRAMSIFRGGFTSSALHAVTGASISELAHLVDYSLVRVTGEGRYDLHPLIYQILQERLHACGELDEFTAAHTTYYAEFLHSRLSDLKGGHQVRAIKDIQSGIKNVRSAWRWIIRHQDYDDINNMWETLHLYTDLIQGEQEFDMIESVRDLPKPDIPEHPVQAYLLVIQSVAEDNVDHAETVAQRALQFADYFQDKRAAAFALRAIGFAKELQNAAEAGLKYYQQSLTIFQELGEDYYVAILLHSMEFVYGTLGKRNDNLACQEERYRICQRINDRMGLASCLHQIGSQELAQGDYTTAELHEKEAYKIAQEFGNWRMIVVIPARLGFFCFLRGDFEGAHRYFTDTLAAADHLGGDTSRIFGIMLGYLANTTGDFVRADTLFTDAQEPSASNPVTKTYVDWGQCIAKCGLRHYTSAASYLHLALSFGVSSDNITFMTLSLPPAALLLWHEGKKALAVECMALWFTHPATQPEWFLNSALGNNILERMKAELGDGEFDQAWQSGTMRDLHATATELLGLFTNKR